MVSVAFHRHNEVTLMRPLQTELCSHSASAFRSRPRLLGTFPHHSRAYGARQPRGEPKLGRRCSKWHDDPESHRRGGPLGPPRRILDQDQRPWGTREQARRPRALRKERGSAPAGGNRADQSNVSAQARPHSSSGWRRTSTTSRSMLLHHRHDRCLAGG